MKREDFRNKVIPTIIENTDNSQRTGNSDFNTTDLIYIESYEDYFDGKHRDMERRVSATDYAHMNNAYLYKEHKTLTNKRAASIWLRSAGSKNTAKYLVGNGSWFVFCTHVRNVGVCPSLHYCLPSDSKELQQLNVRDVKDANGRIIYHTLQIGEYPQTKVNEDLSDTLESLYHRGNLQHGISCTGRWYSTNGQKNNHTAYAGKHCPEFEYQGERYVRVVSYPHSQDDVYSDNTPTDKPGTIRWVKVEPISFLIKNWDELPQNINPQGNGNATYFDLRAEDAIIGNMPFYPEESDDNSSMWQNSTIRGFLNGIDVRNINSNGNVEYGATNGGNFTNECNFLNEAFNSSREPITEYTIPDSETEIVKDAFNGCVTLKKVIIPPHVTTINKKAFEGLQFKYAYTTKDGKLVFSQDLPKNKNEYQNAIELDVITRAFEGFDYSILVKNDKFVKMMEFSKALDKMKFSIPYIYGLTLIKHEKEKSFCQDNVFRFFKNEMPKINEMLLNFPEEEQLDFYKFASALGCFSTEKLLDKNGKDTQVYLAQKASSLLARLVKTDYMRLRSIS